MSQSAFKARDVLPVDSNNDDTSSASFDLSNKSQSPAQQLKNYYLITVVCIIPALALAIPASINLGYRYYGTELLPAIGLLPMGLGAIFSLYRAYTLGFHFSPKIRQQYRIMLPDAAFDVRKHPAFLGPLLESITNLVFGAGILTVLVFTWIELPNRSSWGWRGSPGQWLACYATVPMMVAMIMHAILFWKTMPSCNWKLVLVQTEEYETIRAGRKGAAPLFTGSPTMSGAVADV